MTVLYTTEQVAKQLQVSKRKVEDWVREGKIKSVRLSTNKLVRITPEAVQEFIKSMEG